VYSGEATYSGSTSPAVGQVVTPQPTTTVLTSDANPSYVNQKVNLTATVSPNDATGTVQFDARGDRRNAEMTIFVVRNGRITPVAIVRDGALLDFRP